MDKNNLKLAQVPKTEEIREITENENLQQDKKERNKELIRHNLGYYSIDKSGNFAHIDPNAKGSYIKKEEVNGYERLIKIIVTMIIKETDNEDKKIWEIKEGNYHNKEDDRIMFASAFTKEQNEKIKNKLNANLYDTPEDISKTQKILQNKEPTLSESEKKMSTDELAELLSQRGRINDYSGKGEWINVIPKNTDTNK